MMSSRILALGGVLALVAASGCASPDDTDAEAAALESSGVDPNAGGSTGDPGAGGSNNGNSTQENGGSGNGTG